MDAHILTFGLKKGEEKISRMWFTFIYPLPSRDSGDIGATEMFYGEENWIMLRPNID